MEDLHFVHAKGRHEILHQLKYRLALRFALPLLRKKKNLRSVSVGVCLESLWTVAKRKGQFRANYPLQSKNNSSGIDQILQPMLGIFPHDFLISITS